MVGGGKASCVSSLCILCARLRTHSDDISEMVSLIPRLSSFAVSGTPAKTRVSDLSYVLKSVEQPFPTMVLT